MMKGKIFEIKRFAVHDGDGIRTTAFFKGCPLRCVWCHNPEGLSPKTEEAFYRHKCIGCGECRRNGFTSADCLGEARVTYGREVTVDELFDRLTEDRAFYESSGGGVTLSGGECLMQADFCRELLKRLKGEGIHTAVDTSGYAPRASLDKVIPYTDVFLYDLKAYAPTTHKKCTGVSNEIILENLRYLDSLGKKIEIRIPYVPEYNDGEMEKMAEFIATLKNVQKIRILPYHNHAATKYSALSLESTLPARVPTPDEIKIVTELVRGITGLEVTN